MLIKQKWNQTCMCYIASAKSQRPNYVDIVYIKTLLSFIPSDLSVSVSQIIVHSNSHSYFSPVADPFL